MNIAEILKDCPKGTKLYSPLFGEIKFEQITDNNIIVIFKPDYGHYRFHPDWRYWKYDDAECLLFPSKDNRDWSTFKVPKKEYEFKPFDKVLIRDDNDMAWCCAIFSNIIGGEYKYQIAGGSFWKQCIPYEGNEHFLGTMDNPE